MASISGFEILETLYSSANSLVFRARRSSGDPPTIIKMLEEAYPPPEKIAWFQREYETTRSLKDLDGVIDVFELRRDQDRWLILLEDFGATSLADLVDSESLEIDEILELALTLSQILGEVHRRNIIHQDINPSNLVLNRATGKLKLIDFGISTVLTREDPALRNPSELKGTLAYMSPEQTGRMNRAIDFRTDFYSFGATLYHLLTGVLPFETIDPLELIHSHIARLPVPPDEIDPQIDPVLSEITLKLLAKNAEDRYQSARGLWEDLAKYRDRRVAGGGGSAFPLAQLDTSDQLRIPQKLYGREQETAQLLSAFDRVTAGARELMLVSGHSGVGKSALVKELYRPITRQHGYFISGKFDQLQRDVPYAPIIQAFQDLVRQLLSETNDQITAWREKLLGSLGANSGVIIEVIPELEVILGRQPAVASLNPSETRHRFNLVFQNFIAVFTKPEHPLTLFVDDLQWVDAASIELLQNLMTRSDHHYLFLIGAYRDNEVSDTHPLILTLAQLRKHEVAISEIYLSPLDVQHVHALIFDTLGRDRESTEPLATLAHQKTAGNPFFLNEFLKHLVSEGQIYYSHEHGSWRWSLPAIEACDVTDNVVKLMAAEVQKLDASTQYILQLAACTGSVFDLRTLAVISQQSPMQTAEELWGALREGLVLPLDERYKLTELEVERLLDEVKISYRFAHDRIQQAAYSLIAEAERRDIHWRIGQLLLEDTPEEELEKHIFDIVQQLEHGLASVEDLTRRGELAELFLLAGRKAKASAAYQPALRYFRHGIDLLISPEQVDGRIPSPQAIAKGWRRHPQRARFLFEEAAEAACLIGAYDEMHQLVEVFLNHTEETLDRVRGHRIEIQSHAAQNQLLESVRAGLRALALLGIEIAEEPDPATIDQVAEELVEAWSGSSIEALTELPEMTDPDKLAAFEIMSRLYLPAFNVAPGVIRLIIFNAVLLSIRHGVTVSSPRGFVAYGMLLCGRGEIDAGYRFGQVSMRLADSCGGEDRASVIYMFNHFIRHWREKLSAAPESCLTGYQAGLDAGDVEFACLNLNGAITSSFWSARDLQEISEEATGYLRTTRLLQQGLPNQHISIYQQLILNLLGASEDPLLMIGDALDERVKLPEFRRGNNFNAIAHFFLHKLILSILFEGNASLEYTSEIERHSAGFVGTMASGVFRFYEALALLFHLEKLSVEEKPTWLERVAGDQEKLRNWADHSVENFSAKRDLIAAEYAAAVGDHDGARGLYDEAIRAAQTHGLIQDEALAHELAARFHRRRGYHHLACNYLRDAHYAYQRWGAVAKVRQLEERFPRDLGHSTSTTTNKRPTTAQHATGALDLESVLKASQAISREIVLAKLLERLLRTVIENAGAQRAILILDQEGELVIQAEGHADEEVRFLEAIPIAENPNLLTALVHLVTRTGQAETLDDASTSDRFAADPYVRRVRPKSILCMPLTHQGSQAAILYLENNLATAAFTPERVEILNLLSGEMAIAIDNARLYTELEAANQELEVYSHTLEDKVTERTNELADRNQQLQVTLQQLRNTQEQLILREKMASLGSLTAGIAHEIRNPLNFVNNFAQLSVGLAEEVTEELTTWTQAPGEEQLEDIRQLLGDLASNAARIEEHGKRANDITSSMLLHTQASSDERVATNLNELLSGSIRLAYHGMRSREASFNVEIQESYDDSVVQVELVPQDISRVFINLVENAFYAIRKKQGAGASPTVTVSTAQTDEHVAVAVRDNGIGIAEENLDKIFNPFFTTKSAGEGTGLGLSVSYDIVVRKHQGEIRVDTREGEYTELTVLLPKAAPT